MTYQYKCHKCDTIKEINKPMAESSKEEVCECGELLTRVYVVGVKTFFEGIK